MLAQPDRGRGDPAQRRHRAGGLPLLARHASAGELGDVLVNLPAEVVRVVGDPSSVDGEALD